MTERPESVYIGPHQYEISFKSKHLIAQGEDLFGFTDNRKLRIGVNRRDVLSQQQDTLLHELLHAVFYQSGLSREMGVDKEEKLVRRITPFLLDIVKHNTAVVEFLRGDA